MTNAEIFLEAARLCAERTEGIGYAPYYVGSAQRSYDERSSAYSKFRRLFDSGAAIVGEHSVIALCFAAAMAEAGDL